MPAININAMISVPRALQVVAGGAALYGGWKASSGFVRSAYREDMLGDRKRIVEVDGGVTIFQVREPQGGDVTKIAIGAGVVSAATGAILLGNRAWGNVPLRQGAGAALFALGLGAIAGAATIAQQYSRIDFEPVR